MPLFTNTPLFMYIVNLKFDEFPVSFLLIYFYLLNNIQHKIIRYLQYLDYTNF
jgi:hypothetical protein